MNSTAYAIYEEYFTKTNDAGAAASLTLADVMQTTLDAGQPAAKAEPPRSLTVKQVAENLQLSDEQVLAWIKAGDLQATNVATGKVRPSWRISPAQLAAFERRRASVPATAESPPPRRTRRRRLQPELPAYLRNLHHPTT